MKAKQMMCVGVGIAIVGLALVVAFGSADGTLVNERDHLGVADPDLHSGRSEFLTDRDQEREAVAVETATWQRLSYSTLVTQSAQGRAFGDMRIDLGGLLVSQRLPDVGGRAVRQCRLAVERLRVRDFEGTDAPKFRSDLIACLDQGFLLLQEPTGEAVAMRLPVGSPLPARTLVGDLARSITFRVLPGERGVWVWDRPHAVCREQLQLTQTRLGVGAIDFVCRRASFSPLAGGPASVPKGQLDTEVSWDLADLWPTRLRGHETQIWDLAELDIELDTSVTLVAASPGTNPAFLTTPQWESEWQLLDCAVAIAAANDDAAQQLARDDPRTAAQIVHELVAIVQRGASIGARNALLDALLAQLRLHPDCVHALQLLLLDPAIDELVFDRVMEMVARADTDASEQFMVKFLTDCTLPTQRQCLLVKNCFARGQPAPQMLTALMSIRTSGGRDVEVSDMALLATGALSRFPDENDGWQHFVGLRPDASDEPSLALWLRAAANAGPERALTVARESFDHPSVIVRLAALDAARGSTADEAIVLLRLRSDDPSVAVRAKAVLLLASQSPVLDLPEIQAASLDDVAKIRLALIRGLGSRRDLAAGRAILEGLAASDADATVREAAQRTLRQG